MTEYSHFKGITSLVYRVANNNDKEVVFHVPNPKKTSWISK